MQWLSNHGPDKQNMYFNYYATQVLHHFEGDAWQKWNEGGNGNPGMRDWLILLQDKGTDPKLAHQRGSWSQNNDAHGHQGGRLMVTSLSVLTLEVYYRHLPVFRQLELESE